MRTRSTPSRSPDRAERLVAWRDQLAALQRRSRIYERTLREIETAEQATMKTATRFLERRMVGDMERITGGRYRRVSVDDRTLDIRLHAPEKGDWVDVRSLSQGTLDLVFLSARLGLVRLVTGDRRPPLIFDDPFVTLDEARAGRALELLREMAQRLPGDLPDDVGPLSRRGRLGRRARRARRTWTRVPPPTRRRPLLPGPSLADPAGPGLAVVAFGLGSAIAWGAGDFGGRLDGPAGARPGRSPSAWMDSASSSWSRSRC